jgi:serine/threonine protein kinase
MEVLFNMSIPFHIPRTIRLNQDEFELDKNILPRQNIQGVLTAGGNKRCTIKYREMRDYGAHGSIRMIHRTDLSGGTICCVKIPNNPRYSLCPEAVVQWIAGIVLNKKGIYGAIPRVFDIFQYAGETRFSMEYIDGISAADKILSSDNPNKTFLEIIVQTCILLGVLECDMRLDHRDLKVNNLWIRPVPTTYTVKLDTNTWRIEAPFQVVILDFGFSCVGNRDGNAVVSLSDGILPKIDPCPKKGRDLFQLLCSLLYIPEIRSALQPTLVEYMEQLLCIKNTFVLQPEWVYLMVSDSNFHNRFLEPSVMLESIHLKYSNISLYKE